MASFIIGNATLHSGSVGGIRSVKRQLGPLLWGRLKFNVDRAVREKWGKEVLEGCFKMSLGRCWYCSQKMLGLWSLMRQRLWRLAILEALWVRALASFQAPLVVEIDSLNDISWMSSFAIKRWRFRIYSNEIKSILSSIQVKFQHVRWEANSFVDTLAKEGVDISSNLLAFTL